MNNNIYTAMKLAGIINEENDPMEERIADLKQGLEQAEIPEDAFRMLYKWAIKKTIDQDEFVQLAMLILGGDEPIEAEA